MGTFHLGRRAGTMFSTANSADCCGAGGGTVLYPRENLPSHTHPHPHPLVTRSCLLCLPKASDATPAATRSFSLDYTVRPPDCRGNCVLCRSVPLTPLSQPSWPFASQNAPFRHKGPESYTSDGFAGNIPPHSRPTPLWSSRGWGSVCTSLRSEMLLVHVHPHL